MRLHFTLSPSQEPVPFNYQHFLTGAFHKWLGDNEQHDRISLYSLSWLYDGFARNEALEFPKGARWFISLYDESLIPKMLDNILAQPDVCCGMQVTKIVQQETPRFGDYYAFKVGSPVLAKSKEIEGKVKHYIFSDTEADDVLTATLRHKMDVAGLSNGSQQVNVRFDRSYRYPKTKLVKIKNTANRASLCPVIVEGSPEAVQFAWNVGVGHGTGSGFGSLL
ncbi:MAG: CRISPR-associated endoribonuclease Cas6 [Blastocatellia bacterium]